MDLHDAIEQSLRNGLPEVELMLDLQGNKALVDVVSPVFAGKSRVERSKLVYQCLDSLIKSGALHAVTIRAASPGERGSDNRG